jgi:hypothetical protein
LGRRAVRIAVDTNILVRVVAEDDPVQGARADAELAAAEVVASRYGACLPQPTSGSTVMRSKPDCDA